MSVGKLLPTDYHNHGGTFIRCHQCGDVTALRPDGDRFICAHPCRIYDNEPSRPL